MWSEAIPLGATFARTAAIIRARPGWFAALILIDAGPYMLLRSMVPEWQILSVPLMPVTVFLGLIVTARSLAMLGLADPSPRDRSLPIRLLPAALLLYLLTTVPIALGLLMLFVPGILLTALWSLALPALVSERLTVVQAMRRSWTLVRPELPTFAGLTIMTTAPSLLGLGLNRIGAGPAFGTTAYDLLTAMVISVISILTPVFWAVVYAGKRQKEAHRAGLTPPADTPHPRAYV